MTRGGEGEAETVAVAMAVKSPLLDLGLPQVYSQRGGYATGCSVPVVAVAHSNHASSIRAVLLQVDPTSSAGSAPGAPTAVAPASVAAAVALATPPKPASARKLTKDEIEVRVARAIPLPLLGVCAPHAPTPSSLLSLCT